MSLRTKFFSAGLAVGLFALISGAGFAQQPQTTEKDQSPEANKVQRPFGRQQRGFGRGQGRGFRQGKGHRAFGPRLMQELNLTDDQQQQVRSIMEQNMESTRTQREELRQLGEKRFQGTVSTDDQARARTLHEQMHASMKDTHARIASLLTVEQKTKLEELKKERKANHERFGGKRRGEFPARRELESAPPQKPNN